MRNTRVRTRPCARAGSLRPRVIPWTETARVNKEAPACGSGRRSVYRLGERQDRSTAPFPSRQQLARQRAARVVADNGGSGRRGHHPSVQARPDLAFRDRPAAATAIENAAAPAARRPLVGLQQQPGEIAGQRRCWQAPAEQENSVHWCVPATHPVTFRPGNPDGPRRIRAR